MYKRQEQAPIQKLGENHVFFLPYLMGERSPHNNPDARGVFFGMSMDSTRADMTCLLYTSRHVLIEGNYPHHGAVMFGHYGKAFYEVVKFLGLDVKKIGYNQPCLLYTSDMMTALKAMWME